MNLNKKLTGCLIAIGLIAIVTGIIKIGSLYANPSSFIPLEVFFNNANQKLTPLISPNGKLLAYKAPVDGVTNIWVRSIDKDDDRPVTFDKNRGIQTYLWAFDNEHLLYLQDLDGDENWQLFKVSLKDGTVTSLTPIKGIQTKIIAYTKENPDRMIVGINERDPKDHDAYELDLKTGKLTLLAENSGNIVQWIADKNLQVRAFVKIVEKGDAEIFVRSTAQEPWHSVGVWKHLDGTPYLLSFDANGTHLYLLEAKNTNTTVLSKISILTEESTIIYQDEHYDITETEARSVFNQDTYELEALSYPQERTVWKAFDAELSEDLPLMQALDYGDMILVSRSADSRYWVVAFTKDTGPIAYWLFDRSTKQGNFLFHHQIQLTKYKLAPMKPIKFTSRDGLTIHGYITYPIDKEPKNLPMILHPHGGPWLRDQWGYQPRVQFLANRGYAVLQVNFRGSVGYGKDFINAANKEWGGKMHDDLIDGVQWAINEGIADPQRIAILGGSYGGYAALAGAAFTPDVFKCAVEFIGISNLITFIKSIPPYWQVYHEDIRVRVGDIETEEEFLKERSPLFSAHKIKIPLLIAQGANDARVKQAEAEQIVAALKENNIPHEYLLFEDEGHGFIKPQNSLKFYRAVESFLERYLGK